MGLLSQKPNVTCRDRLRKFVYSSLFQRVQVLFIAANTLTMACEFDAMPPALDKTLEGLNICFTLVFAVEMALKLFVLGCACYWSSRMNCFDGLVVMVSVCVASSCRTKL